MPENAVPPSVGRNIREFVSSDGYKTDLPLFRPANDGRVQLLESAWKKMIGINGVRVNGVGFEECPVADICKWIWFGVA